MSGSGDDTDPSAPVGVVASRRGVTGAVALKVVVTVLPVLAGVAAAIERDWWGVRSFLVGAVAAAVLVALYRGERSGAAAVFCGVGVVVVAPGLGRKDAGLDARLLARDLPPRAVYAVAFGFVVLVVACAVLRRALAMRPGRGSAVEARDRDLRRGLGAGVVGTAVLALSILFAGGVARSVADRWAESDTLVHTLSSPAQQRTESPGPVHPAEVEGGNG